MSSARTLLAACAALAFAIPALADETESAPQSKRKPAAAESKTHGHDHAAAAQPEMSAEEAAQMAAWQAAMTPGSHHAKLEPQVGTFDVVARMWSEPDAAPTESTGRADNRWILGGRYLEQRFTSNFMGMPFEGLGYAGYDNVQKKYVVSWMDNFGTGIMTSTGDVDPSGKVFTYTGIAWDPTTGKETAFREVATIESNDRHRFEMYAKDAKTGKEFRTMEIVYTRVRAAPMN